jgi:hypothetical protein
MAVKKGKTAPTTDVAPAIETKSIVTKPQAPKAEAATAVKAGTPKSSYKKPMPKAVVQAAAPIQLSEKQTAFLQSIRSAGHPGFRSGKKGDIKNLEALLNKKLIKKGSKDKATGDYHYTLSKAGERHLGSTPA